MVLVDLFLWLFLFKMLCQGPLPKDECIPFTLAVLDL